MLNPLAVSFLKFKKIKNLGKLTYEVNFLLPSEALEVNVPS